jgi:hypothetical protein
MGIGRQHIEAQADICAVANTSDISTGNAEKSKKAVAFSAIELWKETPMLSGSVSQDCAIGHANEKHDSFLHGQVEIKELQSGLLETKLNAEQGMEDRKQQLQLALMKINPCAGYSIARGLENMSTDERIEFWKKLMHVPLTTFEGDFAATQARVSQQAAIWVRDSAKRRKEFEQTFFDYDLPVTINR